MHLFQSPHKPPFLTLFKVFSKAALGFRSQTQKAQAFLTAAMAFLLGSLREGKKKKRHTANPSLPLSPYPDRKTGQVSCSCLFKYCEGISNRELVCGLPDFYYSLDPIL